MSRRRRIAPFGWEDWEHMWFFKDNRVASYDGNNNVLRVEIWRALSTNSPSEFHRDIDAFAFDAWYLWFFKGERYCVFNGYTEQTREHGSIRERFPGVLS
ncbi:hypothetical protein [Nocardia sp. NPDC049707]|uniref:hypothetical protein n=1 Tax=Nocardia sp. NPDC049707 TaxID=3154735 RepID=UPI003426AD11